MCPFGLEGDVTVTAQVPGSPSANSTVQAVDLTPGLGILGDTATALSLDGTWRFKPDPESDFVQTNFPDADW